MEEVQAKFAAGFHFGVGNGGMHLGLLVAGLVVAEIQILLEGLAETGDDAVAEDAKTTGKEGLFHPSRSVYWFLRKVMMAWAVVIRRVDKSLIMAPLKVNETTNLRIYE